MKKLTLFQKWIIEILLLFYILGIHMVVLVSPYIAWDNMHITMITSFIEMQLIVPLVIGYVLLIIFAISMIKDYVKNHKQVVNNNS